MTTLRFNENFGSLNADRLLSPSNSTTFGLTGDDILSSTPYSDFNILAGGADNDTYNIGYSSSTTIIDTGGIDRIVATSLGFYDPYTYAATIDGGKHVLVKNFRNGTQISVANWKSSVYSIESITLADGTYSLPFIASTLDKQPNYLGDISINQLINYGILPQGTSSSVLLEFIEYISLTEIAKISDLNQPSLPVITTQKSNLSIIVQPGIIDHGAVYLENLSENFTFHNGIIASHTIDYAGVTFNYSDIDSVIMTVARDGEFTEEFAQEISDYATEAAGISYHGAVQLVGAAYINDTLLFVAGTDGSYIS